MNYTTPIWKRGTENGDEHLIPACDSLYTLIDVLTSYSISRSYTDALDKQDVTKQTDKLVYYHW